MGLFMCRIASIFSLQKLQGSMLKLAYLGFQCLDHPPYSTDLAPSDYNLFSGLKKQLKGHHFSSDAEVIAAAETSLDGQHSEFL
jgi:histone-lysine N-methyltransferase SETMAR